MGTGSGLRIAAALSGIATGGAVKVVILFALSGAALSGWFRNLITSPNQISVLLGFFRQITGNTSQTINIFVVVIINDVIDIVW